MASLCLLGDDGLTTACWELGDHPLAIGRDDSADIRIDDLSLSRRHFVIRRKGDHFQLEDLGSRNGTWVDGNPAAMTRLRHHDCILAGRTLFLFSEATVAKSIQVIPRQAKLSTRTTQHSSKLQKSIFNEDLRAILKL